MYKLTIAMLFTTFVLMGCSKARGDAEGHVSQSAHLNSINIKVVEPLQDNQMKAEAADSYKEDIAKGDRMIVHADAEDIGNRLSIYKENDIIKVYFTNADHDLDAWNITCLGVVFIQ